LTVYSDWTIILTQIGETYGVVVNTLFKLADFEGYITRNKSANNKSRRIGCSIL